MTQTENQKKLLKILSEMFQLDQSDLDFGIYRIMNSKSKEIQEFLENDLISSIKDAFSSNDNSSIQKELDEAIKQAQELGADPETLPKVKELREKLASTTSSSNLENEVFSHLATFFSRYYKDGDFVSLRRYKKDTYAIPYEGEEVKLHWANSDQYYIKSGEYFRDYTFRVNNKMIHLKLSDAETESNNNKATSDKERRFVILEENPCEIIDDELYINFEYKAVGKVKQDKLNEEAISKALESIEKLEFINALNTLAPTEKKPKRTIFEKHLKNYTSRNSFDYFIHKDLGGFLNRELDFYVKNEMLFIDDIMDSPVKYEEVMNKVKTFKSVAQKIIAFLAQLEELQKKLWEKKKFVIETNYCITLDKIPEEYYEEILVNEKQKEEWKKLFDVEVQTLEDLKEEKYLVLDTKFFDVGFKYKLLSEFDNLDVEIDGVLINSENFGALNLLQERYKEQIKTVYIDPPYNTGNDGFLYHDSYQHSSWMSFMYDRLAYAKELMSQDGVIFSSIDDGEQNNLLNIISFIFGKSNWLANLIWKKKYTGGKHAKHFVDTHEYIIVSSKNISNVDEILMDRPTDEKEKFEHTDEYMKERGRYYIRPLKSNLDKRETLIYPIKLPDGTSITTQWICAENTYKSLLKDGRILIKQKQDGNYQVYRKYYEFDGGGKVKVPSLITHTNNNEAKLNLKQLFYTRDGRDAIFGTPKPIKLINYLIKPLLKVEDLTLDFFAGSGTTGHAVINLNREDGGKRKYILVEMGEYFDSVTKPRILKVIYSDSWKDGKPQNKNGISQMFKYFKLESYEDTLNNLEFKRTKEQQATLKMYPEAKEDYMLNYSLNVESQSSLLNIDNFTSPLNYKLKIATSSVGETKDTNIDLVETFNYLLGLVVKRMEFIKDYLVVEGKNLKGEKILIIWRNEQSSDELNEFFEKMDWSVYDREFDTIYVNGDNNLDNLKKDEDHFKVKLIEQEFKKLMFGD